MLRDDVKALLLQLLSLKKDKLSAIKDLQFKEEENRYLLKSDNINGLEDNLLQIQQILDKIDLIMFKIAGLYNEIQGIMGIDQDKLLELIKTGPSKIFYEIIDTDSQIIDLGEKIRNERESLIEQMKSKSGKIKKDIGELNDIDRIIKNTTLLNKIQGNSNA